MENMIIAPSRMAISKGHNIAALSGALTVIVAGADVYGLQNDAADKPLVVGQITMGWFTTTAFGAAQAVPFGLWKVTGFTAIHDTGTGIKTIAPHRKRVALHRALAGVNVRMAAAVAISNATYDSPDADEPDMVLMTTLATSPIGENIWTPGDFLPFVLDENEGIIVRPLITMGATGVGNLYIKVEVSTKQGEAAA